MPPAILTKLDFIPAALATLVCVGFFGLIFTLIFHQVPQQNHDIVIALIGAISGSVTTIVAFYFGSSKSSQTKDETIQEIAKK